MRVQNPSRISTNQMSMLQANVPKEGTLHQHEIQTPQRNQDR
jgi:hypothetical protein